MLLLGHDIVDVGLETRVGLKDLCAHATLGGGLDLSREYKSGCCSNRQVLPWHNVCAYLALLAGGELGSLLVLVLIVDFRVRTNFLLEHDCGYVGGVYQRECVFSQTLPKTMSPNAPAPPKAPPQPEASQ